ncbi:MAG: glycosyltransferase family 4 protein [Bacteroidales bacterium]|nr:glycosyltransferase family 4 protein [Bacteroidales bacterium]
MKIGFDAKRYYHNHTGLGNYSRSIIKGLQALYPDDDYLLYDEKTFSRTFKLGRKAARDGCTLFHGLSNELPSDILKSGVRSILTFHDVAWRTYPQMYHWLDRQIYDFKYGRSCHVANHVIAISESTKKDIIRFYDIPEVKISVIYQPVQDLFYKPLSQEEADKLIADAVASGMISSSLPQDFILNVGSINSRKNLLGLVQALELIPTEQRPPLLVVGNGREYKQDVLNYIAKHHLEQYVRIETRVSDNKVLQALYSKALLMAYPSHYEGFGLPVVEAALQQCPILTSNVSSLPEAAGPGALLCDPDDVESIHKYLTELLDDSSMAQRLAEVAEEYARSHFDPRSLTEQLHDLYNEIALV